MINDSQGAYSPVPLDFRVPEATIGKIAHFAADDGATGRVCAHLCRATPRVAADVEQAMVCTSDSSAGPRVVGTTQISFRKVKAGRHAPHLLIGVSGTAVRFYGVLLTYRY